MIRRSIATLVGLGSLALPHDLPAQRVPPLASKTVLFVCEHGTVKSLLAKVLFDQYAREVGLQIRAESRGTRADSVVPPWMLRGLALDQVNLGSWHPRTLGASDLAAASYVVSFDVPDAATAAAHAPRTQWNGLPSVTQDYAKGRDAIKTRIHRLVDSLKRAEKSPNLPDGVMLEFVRFANIFGSRLVSAFDSIPADKYDYRPTPSQQTIGYIAQHLENANYGLCERLGSLKHPRTAKDSLADTLKARWPKDTLIRRLEASLHFCDDAMERVERLQSAALTSTLLAIETDLAEHYSQIAVYMRLLGLVPPSALPPTRRTAIELPASSLSSYVGVFELAPGLEFEVTMRDGMLFIRSSTGGGAVRLWPESHDDFFVNEVDAQVTFTRIASGSVNGLVLHQYGRNRPARKIR